MSCDDGRLKIFGTDSSITVSQQSSEVGSNVVVNDSDTQTVTIAVPGPRGPIGPTGPAGINGAGEPFYEIVSGELYGSTGSIAMFAAFSSSLCPYTQSVGIQPNFDLGASSEPWRHLYIQSMSLVDSRGLLVTLNGGQNYIEIGYSVIETGSFGFDRPIIQRRDTFADIVYSGSLTVKSDGVTNTMTIQSESVDRFKVNNIGLTVFGEFDTLPSPEPGGIVYYGDDFYLGFE